MVSEHSLVEFLGPPPPKVTPEQEAAVRARITRSFPTDDPSDVTARGEIEAMLFSKPRYDNIAGLVQPVSFKGAREARAERLAPAVAA